MSLVAFIQPGTGGGASERKNIFDYSGGTPRGPLKLPDSRLPVSVLRY